MQMEAANSILRPDSIPGPSEPGSNMTLFKQLFFSIVLMFLLGFLATVTISTKNLGDFLAEQLASSAQDTATSLGLSLSPHMPANDLPMMQTMVDAVFDRGFYTSIVITRLDGTEMIRRERPVETGDVPAWFIGLISLETPMADALIMSGWNQGGTIVVTSNSGHAYRDLWGNTVDTIRLFFLSAIITLVIGFFAIRTLFKPLRDVEAQAEAICNRSYPQQNKLPRTRELRRVVEAMNRLSTKVNEFFAEQSALSGKLREQAFQDPVTHLGNRRYFDRQVENLVSGQTEAVQAALLLIEINNLEDINREKGFSDGDTLLKRAGELINAVLDDQQHCFIARTSGACFSVIAANCGPEDADKLASHISSELMQLHTEGHTYRKDVANIGISLWQPGTAASPLLCEANIALRAAQSSGETSWQRQPTKIDNQSAIRDGSYWQHFLKETIEQENIELHAQPVVTTARDGSTLLHREILARIPGDDTSDSLTAGIFMPMAERIGLGSAMDKLVISKTMAHIKANSSDDAFYSVNINSSSLHNPAFIQWLSNYIRDNRQVASRLTFEFPEYAVLRDISKTCRTIHRLAELGCHCGIDHFGLGFISFSYLRSIDISYIKIDGSYIHELQEDKDNQFFIENVARTAHSVDISVIAERVETEAERTVLEALKLDGIQGYLTGRPEKL